MAYTLNRPTASELLQDSQPLIRDNFNAADASFGIDHFAFSDSTSDNGRHKNIRQPQQTRARSGAGAVYSNFPANISQVNQIVAAAYTPDTTGGTADTQLFNVTGSGGISQLTGNSTASSTDGWCWCGGILIQWGNKTGFSGSWPTSEQTVTFKDRVAGAIPFPNNCFSVTTTFIGPTSTSSGDICITSVSKTRFKWIFTGSSSSSFDGFYWVAIGN